MKMNGVPIQRESDKEKEKGKELNELRNRDRKPDLQSLGKQPEERERTMDEVTHMLQKFEQILRNTQHHS